MKEYTNETNNHGDVLSNSTGYVQRFVTFVVFTQLLYVFLFILVRLFGWFGWFDAIRWAILGIFVLGFVMLMLFLFIGVKAKALSFYLSGILYLVGSILIARWIGTDISITDMTFLGGWSSWNVGYSVIILLVGTVRTFLLGFVHDYK